MVLVGRKQSYRVNSMAGTLIMLSELHAPKLEDERESHYTKGPALVERE